MKKKILVIFVVSMFLLMGLSTIITAKTTSSKNEKLGGPLGDVTIYISEDKEFIFATCNIVMGGILEGNFYYNLNVIYEKVYSPYEVKGKSTVFVAAVPMIPISDTIVFLNNVEETFDYGMGEDPDEIHDSYYRSVPWNSYVIQVLVVIEGDIYENGEKIDDFLWTKSWSKSKVKNNPSNIVKDFNHDINNFNLFNNKPINTPFLNFLQNHLNMFPLLRQILGL